MDPYDKAVDDLAKQAKPNISATARVYNVDKTVLRRRWKKLAGTQAQKNENQQLLKAPQEAFLIQYINKLTVLAIPPTPGMIFNFAYEIAGQEPGKNWVSRFVARHSNQLESAYLNPLDKERKKSESYSTIEAYFNLIKHKTAEYEVLPHNIYNMDEKGFILGFMQKVKRVFTKGSKTDKFLIGNVQDGNRDWLTVIGCICADGTALPPGLIYRAISGNLQDSWLQDLDVERHIAFFTSSPNGWTDNKLGFSWLKEVFNRETKAKARNGRDWRLLMLDGHGSHLTMEFINWALEHRILLGVYPPHSTHRLQPLDVSCFGPLAEYYHQSLDQHMAQSQALSSISKRDFLRLFWPAWTKSFTSKNILSGFSKTGLYPLNAIAVLSQLQLPQNRQQVDSRPSTSGSSALSASEWRKIRALVTEATKEAITVVEKARVNKLNATLLKLSTEVSILRAENTGFKIALTNEKKKRKRGRTLIEEVRAEGGQGGMWWSPKKAARAIELQEARDKAKDQDKVDKTQKKKETALKTAQKRIAIEQRKVERLKAQKEREEKQANEAIKKQKVKETKEANNQLQEQLQASAKTSKRGKKAVILPPVPQPIFEEPMKPIQLEKPASTKSRQRRLPARYRDTDLDISRLHI